MIDLKDFGLLYRMDCLREPIRVLGDDIGVAQRYESQGLAVMGDASSGSNGAMTVDCVTPDGKLVVALMKRQMRICLAAVAPFTPEA